MKLPRKFFAILSGMLTVLVVIFYHLLRTSEQQPLYVLPVNSSSLKGSWQTTPVTTRKQGYLVALKYYEQQTQATKNFLQLQCLAHSFGMRIVEPFVNLFTISFPFTEMTAKNQSLLKFGDLIDMGLWNEQTWDKYRYMHVAKWEEFLQEAPRSVVVVCVRYRDPPVVAVPVPGQSYQKGCKSSCYRRFNASLTYLSLHGFRLVRKVCANFAGYAGSVMDQKFKEDILGYFKAERVTVLFNEFRGFFGLYRMQVLSHCGLTHNKIDISVMPSARLVKEVQDYVHVNFDSRPYISILVRIEKLVLHSRLNVTKCAVEVLEILKSLGHSHSVYDYFLAMDVGEFESRGSINHHLQPFGETFFRLIYSTKWSFKEWEDSFKQSSSDFSPAYIANYQRTLAANGDCLIMVGAGGFQAKARDLYDTYHAAGSKRCVYKVCSEPLDGVT